MTNEEYVFRQDVAERKRNSWGATQKVRHSKGRVRMQSDYLSKKERNAMNGEMMSYNLKTLDWNTFKSLLKDSQRMIVETYKSYGARCVDVADLLGTNMKCCSAYIRQHIPDVSWGRGGAPAMKASWAEYMSDASAAEPEIKPETKVAEEMAAEKKAEVVTVEAGSKAELQNVMKLLETVRVMGGHVKISFELEL